MFCVYLFGWATLSLGAESISFSHVLSHLAHICPAENSDLSRTHALNKKEN